MLAYREEHESDGIHYNLVMTSPCLLQNLVQYGDKVVGLDAVWKYTVYKTPIWILVFSAKGKSYVGAYFICTDGTADSVGWCLTQIQRKLSPSWKPFFMIDHDEAEKAAIEACGVSKVEYFVNILSNMNSMK